MKNEIAISKELIEATKAYLTAKAYTETIRPIVESYQKETLLEMQAVSEFDGQLITDPSNAYQMNDELFAQVYVPTLEHRHFEHGFKVPQDCCPLLMAENVERKANNAMLEAATYFTGLDVSGILCAANGKGLEIYKEMTELLVKAVTSYPGFKMTEKYVVIANQLIKQ